MISVGCYFLAYLFETLTSHMYFSNKFTRKTSSTLLFCAYSLSLSVQFGISFLGNPYINMASFLVCNFLLCHLCYNTNLKQSVFNSVVLTALMFTTELVIMYISMLLFGIEVEAHMTNDLILFTQIGGIKLLYFFVTYLISKLTTKESRKSFKHTRSLLLLMLPIASILLLLGIVRITELYNTHTSVYYIFFIATILLLYSNIIVFRVHESLIKAMQENFEFKLERQITKINTEHYDILQNQYEFSNILIHDTKRHLLSIRELAENKDNTRIINYIDELYETYQIKNLTKYSDHKIVNAIVTRYAEICRLSGISLYCDIRNIDFSFTSDNNLTSIFDNILENAVEAAKDSTEKRIELSVKEANKNFIVIIVENSCSQKPGKTNGEYKTTKQDKDLHGFGLKSVKRIVKQHNGKVYCSFDSEKMLFTTSIVLSSK